MRRSGVADANTGASLTSEIRTSSGMFYNRGQTELIRRIEDRIARWTMLPAGNGEGMQVLRYEVGGRCGVVRCGALRCPDCAAAARRSPAR